MINNKQKAKDLIFIAKKLMENVKFPKTTELRETVRLYLKEFNSIKKPFVYGEDDDIISFREDINKWYEEVYTCLFEDLRESKELNARNTTTILKQMNQIKDDVNKAYNNKISGIYTVRAEKFRVSKKESDIYEYELKHGLGMKNIIYTIRDTEGDTLLNMCKVIDEDTLLVRNDEKITVEVIIKKPFAIDREA